MNLTQQHCLLITTKPLPPSPQAKAMNLKVKKLSGTKFRQMLRSGDDIPEWFAFKSVVQVLRQHAQTKH